MPYTFEDYQRDYVLEHFHKLPPSDLLAALSKRDISKEIPKQELQALINKWLAGLTPEEKADFLKGILKFHE